MLCPGYSSPQLETLVKENQSQTPEVIDRSPSVLLQKGKEPSLQNWLDSEYNMRELYSQGAEGRGQWIESHQEDKG